MMENDTFWVVWREGDRNPVVKHETLTLACLEAGRLSRENPGATFYVLQSVELFRAEPDPIKRVWEQYRHMDELIGDRMWLMYGDGEPSPQRQCLFDLWSAIKESQGGKE